MQLPQHVQCQQGQQPELPPPSDAALQQWQQQQQQPQQYDAAMEQWQKQQRQWDANAARAVPPWRRTPMQPELPLVPSDAALQQWQKQQQQQQQYDAAMEQWQKQQRQWEMQFEVASAGGEDAPPPKRPREEGPRSGGCRVNLAKLVVALLDGQGDEAVSMARDLSQLPAVASQIMLLRNMRARARVVPPPVRASSSSQEAVA